uniref:Uncharacterized protein n=1 Tax=Anguilla anguilla TaxID=7936 RepID=A0A0E9WZ08_ANGAN
MTHEHYLIKFNFSLGLRQRDSAVLVHFRWYCDKYACSKNSEMYGRVQKKQSHPQSYMPSLYKFCISFFVCIDSSSYHNT